MTQIIIYTTRICPYCSRAKNLLKRKGVEFKEISVDDDSEQKALMVKRSGRDTVPQIFIGATHIGGYDDMALLDACGELDELLEQ